MATKVFRPWEPRTNVREGFIISEYLVFRKAILGGGGIAKKIIFASLHLAGICSRLFKPLVEP
jgi:hypothetical protein